MTDDTLHPDDELASAYLDDELDAVSRAQVDGSPELLRRVEILRQVRAAIVDTPAPPPAERDVALAAALSVFDGLATESEPDTASPAVVAPNVVPLRRRRTTTILSAAAALLLVGVVGVAAFGGGSDDDDSTGVAQDAPTELVAADAATAAASSPSDGYEDAAGGATVSTIAGISGPAEAAPQVDDTEELLDIADELAPMSVTADSEAPAETAAKSTQAPQPGARNSDVAFGCPLGPDQVYVTTVIWVDTTAAVLRDVVTGEVTAIDQQCNVLASVTP
jgi:hypothetical protein